MEAGAHGIEELIRQGRSSIQIARELKERSYSIQEALHVLREHEFQAFVFPDEPGKLYVDGFVPYGGSVSEGEVRARFLSVSWEE